MRWSLEYTCRRYILRIETLFCARADRACSARNTRQTSPLSLVGHPHMSEGALLSPRFSGTTFYRTRCLDTETASADLSPCLYASYVRSHRANKSASPKRHRHPVHAWVKHRVLFIFMRNIMHERIEVMSGATLTSTDDVSSTLPY